MCIHIDFLICWWRAQHFVKIPKVVEMYLGTWCYWCQCGRIAKYLNWSQKNKEKSSLIIRLRCEIVLLRLAKPNHNSLMFIHSLTANLKCFWTLHSCLNIRNALLELYILYILIKNGELFKPMVEPNSWVTKLNCWVVSKHSWIKWIWYVRNLPSYIFFRS